MPQGFDVDLRLLFVLHHTIRIAFHSIFTVSDLHLECQICHLFACKNATNLQFLNL